MKKLFVAATLGLVLVACGGEDEKSENSGKTENTAPTVCDCLNQAKVGKVDEKCQKLEKDMDPKALQEELGKCK